MSKLRIHFNEIQILFFITFYARFLMKFIHKYHETPLFIAVDKGNIEIVKLLLSCEKIDVNALNKIFTWFVL